MHGFLQSLLLGQLLFHGQVLLVVVEGLLKVLGPFSLFGNGADIPHLMLSLGDLRQVEEGFFFQFRKFECTGGRFRLFQGDLAFQELPPFFAWGSSQ